MTEDLRAQLGSIDIYWFDQLLRGHVPPTARILDAGCGGGRNVHYLLRQGYDVSAVDRDAASIARVRSLAEERAPGAPSDRFVQADLEALPYPDDAFDVVICCAVLHFARDEPHFLRMIDELGRVLALGLLFVRLASNIGIEDRVAALGAGQFRLPDGSDRFLVDEAQLLALTARLGGRLEDPIKTTNVQGLRCMTTWCVRLGSP